MRRKERTTVSLSLGAAAVFDLLTKEQRRYVVRLVRLAPPRNQPYRLRAAHPDGLRVCGVCKEDTSMLVPGLFATQSALWEWAMIEYAGPIRSGTLLSEADMQTLDSLWPTST